jgi:hypothetical protein
MGLGEDLTWKQLRPRGECQDFPVKLEYDICARRVIMSAPSFSKASTRAAPSGAADAPYPGTSATGNVILEQREPGAWEGGESSGLHPTTVSPSTHPSMITVHLPISEQKPPEEPVAANDAHLPPQFRRRPPRPYGWEPEPGWPDLSKVPKPAGSRDLRSVREQMTQLRRTLLWVSYAGVCTMLLFLFMAWTATRQVGQWLLPPGVLLVAFLAGAVLMRQRSLESENASGPPTAPGAPSGK